MVAGIVAVGASRGRGASPPAEMTSQQWIALGTVFLVVGIATMPTLGLGMIGMTVGGVIFLAMGLRARRDEAE